MYVRVCACMCVYVCIYACAATSTTGTAKGVTTAKPSGDQVFICSFGHIRTPSRWYDCQHVCFFNMRECAYMFLHMYACLCVIAYFYLCMYIPTAYTPTTAALVRAQGGDTVQEGKAFVPEVLFKGQYYPICGHYFWDNNNGATTFCNLLGFQIGKITRIHVVYDVDAMPVGKCKSGEALTKCTDGGNAWGEIDFDYNPGSCKKGSKSGVTLTCDSPGASRLGIGDPNVCFVCLVCKCGIHVFMFVYTNV